MKRFLKVFSLIILFVGAFFLFSSEARANFAESFTEVVDSLRGVEEEAVKIFMPQPQSCLLYTSPSPRDQRGSRMPSSA